MPQDLFTDFLSIMDNIHLLTVVILMSFGMGHAILRSQFGIMTLAFLSLFVYFLYFQIQGTSWNMIAIMTFIAGGIYAYRESTQGLVDDVVYIMKEALSKLTFIPRNKPKQESTNQDNSSQQQAWQDEQARREAEVKAQRQKNEHQEQKREQPKKEPKEQEKAKNQTDNRNQQKPNHKSKPKPPIKQQGTDDRTPMEILGLSTGFTQEELKRAYKRESARCHPDKWMNKPEHIRQAMEEEQKLVNRAYNKLK